MTNFPAPAREGDMPLFINTSGFLMSGFLMRTVDQITATASTAWVQNLAIYQPFVLPRPYTVRRLFWFNGSTLTGPPNVDVGIYSPDGTRLCSTGNVAQSGTSSPQFAAPTTVIILPPGRYYWALSSSSNAVSSQFCYGGVSVGAMAGCGLMQQASANPLPASATFARATNALMPFGGLTRTASGF